MKIKDDMGLRFLISHTNRHLRYLTYKKQLKDITDKELNRFFIIVEYAAMKIVQETMNRENHE